MVGDWTVRSLEDCMAAIIDYRGKTPQKTSFGIPLITAKVVKGGRIRTPDEFIAVEDYELWMRRGIPNAGDVVITTEAPLGEVAQLGTVRVALAQRLIALRGKSGVLDNGFLKFLMQSEHVQGQLRARASGTTVLGIKQSELRKVSLTLPPLSEQRAIAHILGTLDDKIELNRRMNETLEAIAQALFKSWFVDFDPVLAKAEGRDPGLPKHIADLFPDSFEDSELGEIPKGWRAAPIGQIAKVTIGGDWGKDVSFADAVETVCLRGVDLERLRNEGWADPPRRWITASSIEKRCLSEKDVLIAGSGAGPTGRPLWVSSQLNDLWGLPVTFSNFCKRFRCASKESAIYLDRCLHLMRESNEIWEYVNGTSVPNLDTGALLRGKWIVIPDVAVLRLFASVSDQISQRLLLPESRTLAALRDTLLPRLISGELRIKDAERVIEKVTA